MAYIGHNKLILVEKVQQIYLDHKEEGISNLYIYRKFVYPQFFISLRTFYLWLNVNVKQERKKIAEKHPNIQLSLFQIA